MKFTKTKLKDVFIIELEPKADKRGSFSRTFCQRELSEQGITFNVTQASLSINKHKGTLRGIHFQKKPKEEGKLAICLKGKIYDVVVDLRPDSQTYGEWISAELSESESQAIHVPKGCAHGFLTLQGDCEILYFMSEFYSPEHYAGVRWNDPAFKIEWPKIDTIISDQDQNWPDFDLTPRAKK